MNSIVVESSGVLNIKLIFTLHNLSGTYYVQGHVQVLIFTITMRKLRLIYYFNSFTVDSFKFSLYAIISSTQNDDHVSIFSIFLYFLPLPCFRAN